MLIRLATTMSPPLVADKMRSVSRSSPISGGTAAELLSGAAKGLANGFISLSTGVNAVLDLAIGATGLTDFQFGQTEALPMTSTEQAGAIMADVVVAGATAGESLLATSGTATRELTTVGRWMGTGELGAMQKSGMVQESWSGTTHVTMPPNPNAIKAASPGSVFAEFGVPSGSVKPTLEGWGKIIGPNSLREKGFLFRRCPRQQELR